MAPAVITVSLTLPQIITLSNQLIKLDTSFIIENVQSVDGTLSLKRSTNNGDFIFLCTYSINTDSINELSLTPNLTWVDQPSPGSHVYEASVTLSQASLNNFGSRSLNAIVFDDTKVPKLFCAQEK
ncbi:hypothetical protein [Bacillus sp. SM2101]|uniref:hypothetical protein n=1 Tax=Bacillus sp. SM2101 TaxID=2805366 RepID=UPI001BDE7644|nr:hypothetical protein [Bacillus sp. SM2101]